jgi:hypothetical protein
MLIRMPDRMRPVGKCKCKWEDNIRMDLTEIG